MTGFVLGPLHHRDRQFGLATVGLSVDVTLHRTGSHRVEVGDGATNGADGGHDLIIPRPSAHIDGSGDT